MHGNIKMESLVMLVGSSLLSLCCDASKGHGIESLGDIVIIVSA